VGERHLLAEEEWAVPRDNRIRAAAVMHREEELSEPRDSLTYQRKKSTKGKSLK